MTGPLPDDFLQIPGNPAPYPIQQQQMAFGGFHQSTVGILNITVVQVRVLCVYFLVIPSYNKNTMYSSATDLITYFLFLRTPVFVMSSNLNLQTIFLP